MASLTAHLVTSGDHGRLGFHPDCPACSRARLFGSLSSEPVVSRRAQAALASGVLALSAVGPPAAVAQEPDHQLEGGSEAAPDGGVGAPSTGPTDAPITNSDDGTDSPSTIDPLAAPDTDPLTPDETEGSDLRDIVPVETAPVEAPSSPPAPSPDLEAEPAPDSLPPDTPQPEVAPEPVSPDSSTETPPPQPLPNAETPAAPSPNPAIRTSEPPGIEVTAETYPRDHTAPSPTEAAEPQASATHTPSAPPTGAAPPPAASSTAAPSAPAPAAAVPLSNARPTAESDEVPRVTGKRGAADERFLIVQPGDSLWSIAKRLLGAGASPAQIARKVSSLWDLNRDRIATGRPDLLLVGTKLELR